MDNRWDNDVQNVEYAPENAARWAGRKVRLPLFRNSMPLSTSNRLSLFACLSWVMERERQRGRGAASTREAGVSFS